MGSYSYASQIPSSQSTSQSNVTHTEPGVQAQGNTRSSSAALKKLTGGNSGAAAPVDLGAVRDGGSFIIAASAALDALVPGPGSFANLTIGGRLPIYSTGAMTAFLEPSLMLQAARTDKGKLEVTMESVLAIKAEAGATGSPWWPAFLGYFKAYARGSLKICGDSAVEIFREFMLTLRMVLEGACDAAGAPPEIKMAMASGVLAQNDNDATVKGMDTEDGVTVAIGGGAEAGVKTSVGDAKGGADLEFSKTISNSNGDNTPEVSAKTSVSLKGELELKKFGLKVTPALTFVFQNGELNQWYFALSGIKARWGGPTARAST